MTGCQVALELLTEFVEREIQYFKTDISQSHRIK